MYFKNTLYYQPSVAAVYNFYPLMNRTRIYLSLAKLFKIVKFQRGDELKRRKEISETT